MIEAALPARSTRHASRLLAVHQMPFFGTHFVGSGDLITIHRLRDTAKPLLERCKTRQRRAPAAVRVVVVQVSHLRVWGRSHGRCIPCRSRSCLRRSNRSVQLFDVRSSLQNCPDIRRRCKYCGGDGWVPHTVNTRCSMIPLYIVIWDESNTTWHTVQSSKR